MGTLLLLSGSLVGYKAVAKINRSFCFAEKNGITATPLKKRLQINYY